MRRGVLAIDPGNERSAWVRVVDGVPVAWDKAPCHDVLVTVAAFARTDELTIEWPAQAGPGGVTILDTAAWAGRYLQRWLDAGGPTPALVRRVEVKRHLLGNVAGKRGGKARSADAQVRAAVLEREQRIRGSVEATAGMAADVWQAYALAITYDEVFRTDNRPEGTTR